MINVSSSPSIFVIFILFSVDLRICLGVASIVQLPESLISFILIIVTQVLGSERAVVASYGRFLTPAQVAALVAPSPASQQTILQWLDAYGTLPLYDQIWMMDE